METGCMTPVDRLTELAIHAENPVQKQAIERVRDDVAELADAADYALRTKNDADGLSDTAIHNLYAALAAFHLPASLFPGAQS